MNFILNCFQPIHNQCIDIFFKFISTRCKGNFLHNLQQKVLLQQGKGKIVAKSLSRVLDIAGCSFSSLRLVKGTPTKPAAPLAWPWARSKREPSRTASANTTRVSALPEVITEKINIHFYSDTLKTKAVYWLGASDFTCEKKFKWCISGELMVNSNYDWIFGQPNNALFNQHCMTHCVDYGITVPLLGFQPGDDGLNDWECWELNQYICE